MRTTIRMKYVFAFLALCSLPLLFAACGGSKADVASRNISKAAEQFQVYRRIVGINGITDKYLFEITGFCSVQTTDSALGGSLEVTCRTGQNKQGQWLYKKAFVGLSDNVTYTVEQLAAINVSASHYRMIFRPTTIIPDISN